MVPHPTSRAFVVRFLFIANLLIDALVCFRPHRMSNLPRRCHRPFFLHLCFPNLFLLLIRLCLSSVQLCYTLCGNRLFASSNFLFSPCVLPEGPHPGRAFLSLKSSSARVTVRTASNHSPLSTYSRCQSRRNASTGSSSSIIFLQAIPVTLAWILRFSISIKNWAPSPRYLTDTISRRDFSASWVGPKRRRGCCAQTCLNSYPSCHV